MAGVFVSVVTLTVNGGTDAVIPLTIFGEMGAITGIAGNCAAVAIIRKCFALDR